MCENTANQNAESYIAQLKIISIRKCRRSIFGLRMKDIELNESPFVEQNNQSKRVLIYHFYDQCALDYYLGKYQFQISRI